MPAYQLVTYGEAVTLILYVSQCTEKLAAMKDIKKFADENNHVILSRSNENEATSCIEELILQN